MDKKIVVVTITLLAVVILASGCINTKNQSNQNSTTNVSQNSTAQNVYVIAVQSGPATAHKGENITIKYSVANKGNNSVFNVKATSQSINNNLGTINPGETIEFQSILHIPTDQEVQEDFGSNATVTNPFFIGGFAVTFQDTKGSQYTINSNPLTIPLV